MGEWVWEEQRKPCHTHLICHHDLCFFTLNELLPLKLVEDNKLKWHIISAKKNKSAGIFQ